MKPIIQIRKFEKNHLDECINLFRDTVHTINIQDYSLSQVNAWAPKNIDKKRWLDSLSKNITYVATYNDQIIGFANISMEGCLENLYVHKNFQRQGVAAALINKIEEQANMMGLKKIYAEISITAKPLAEAFGYKLLKKQVKEFNGEKFINYLMEKDLHI